MTAFDYTSMAATAESMIERFGRDASLIQVSRTPADASNRQRGNVTTETSTSVKAVILNPRSATGLGFSAQQIESLIRNSQMVAIVAGTGLGATLKGWKYNRFEDGAEVWGIVRVDTLKPGDTILLYFFTVKAKR